MAIAVPRVFPLVFQPAYAQRPPERQGYVDQSDADDAFSSPLRKRRVSARSPPLE